MRAAPPPPPPLPKQRLGVQFHIPPPWPKQRQSGEPLPPSSSPPLLPPIPAGPPPPIELEYTPMSQITPAGVSMVEEAQPTPDPPTKETAVGVAIEDTQQQDKDAVRLEEIDSQILELAQEHQSPSGDKAPKQQIENLLRQQDIYVCDVSQQDLEEAMRPSVLELEIESQAGFMEPERIVLKQRIGRGAAGQVYRGLLDNRIEVAVKQLFDSKRNQKGKRLEFMQEAKLLKQLSHRHIVEFYGMCIQNDKLLIVTQFCDRGSLGKLLKSQNNIPLPLEASVTLARQVSEAIAFLHDKNVVHRDLKPDNILLETKSADAGSSGSGRIGCSFGDARVCDLGLARVQEGIYTSMTAGVGTAIYMPPEAIQMDTHLNGKAMDMYAFAMLLYYLLTGREAWANQNSMQVMFKLGNDPRIRPPLPTEPHDSQKAQRGTWLKVRGLIVDSWATRPADRPPFSTAAQSLRQCYEDLVKLEGT